MGPGVRGQRTDDRGQKEKNFEFLNTIGYFTPHYEGLRRPDLRFTTESQRTQRTVFFLRPGGDGRRKEPPPVAKAL